MRWREFVPSIISSFAWPASVVVVAVPFRRQLAAWSLDR